MTQSTEMKDFQEEQYQLWLELNKEYLVRFLKENISIMTDYVSCGGGKHRLIFIFAQKMTELSHKIVFTA